MTTFELDRTRLVWFFDVTESILHETLIELQRNNKAERKLDQAFMDNVALVYADASKQFRKWRSQLKKQFTHYRRRMLREVGLAGKTLLAKLQLLWDCIRDGVISPILEMLNSILGSLAKVFPPLHAIKEAKEVLEMAIARLGPEGGPIQLNIKPVPIPES